MATLLYRTAPSPTQLAAMALVLAAVYLDLRPTVSPPAADTSTDAASVLVPGPAVEPGRAG